MLEDRFIFKVYRTGRVERIKDHNNITFSDLVKWLGTTLNDIVSKKLCNSNVYAFYGDEKSEMLVFGVLETNTCQLSDGQRNGSIHGIQASQFKMLSN